MKIYAGIGSRRRTPVHILELMTQVAHKLEILGWKLRSGHAQGADQAFENGVIHNVNKEIFTPKQATFEAIKIAAECHPFWDQCNELTRKLHGRNSLIILGQNLKEPVKFVVCYTPDGKNSGGTGIALKIAEAYQIPIFNLYYQIMRDRVSVLLNKPKDLDIL